MAEIGLLRALGMTAATVATLFLLESTLLAMVGGMTGLVASALVGTALRAAIHGFPYATPPWAVFAGLGTSLVVGIAAGVLPARRAAHVDPVEALREE